LSKPISIFQDGCNKQIFGKNMGAEEGLLLKENGQELNEMIRDKVSETVVKMNEVCMVGINFKVGCCGISIIWGGGGYGKKMGGGWGGVSLEGGGGGGFNTATAYFITGQTDVVVVGLYCCHNHCIRAVTT
jgi:hypothetical protein